MWLIINYKPINLFSLKDSRATSMGGKSLISVSPYAVKMAIISNYIQLYSVEDLEDNFDWIKGLAIKTKLPKDIVVNNCFLRIQKLKREENKKDTDDSIFQSSVAFREYIYFGGNLEMAINIKRLSKDQIDKLETVLMHINYFGKRGSFFQIIPLEGKFFKESGDLEDGFGEELSKSKYLNGLVYLMDDFGSKIKSFDNVNSYSKSSTDRLPVKYCFPYGLVSSSKSYYHFRCIL